MSNDFFKFGLLFYSTLLKGWVHYCLRHRLWPNIFFLKFNLLKWQKQRETGSARFWLNAIQSFRILGKNWGGYSQKILYQNFFFRRQRWLRWVCWTSKSDLSSTTKCDQNHIYGGFKIWSHLKLELGMRFCSTNQPFITPEQKLGLSFYLSNQHILSNLKYICYKCIYVHMTNL